MSNNDSSPDRFTLEQAIMDAWHTTDDIKLLCNAVANENLNTDEIANALIGLQHLHDLRARRVLDIFEYLVEIGDVK